MFQTLGSLEVQMVCFRVTITWLYRGTVQTENINVKTHNYDLTV